MFGAGTDTTSTSLVWAIGELLRNPRVMKELQQEARKIGQLSPISYLPDSEPIQQESSADSTTSRHNYSWKTTLTA
ncbi:hypothetical protein E3N88_29465 [Mikania micrantha]|uniref:Uncharacterized protein n=1 Tax=Mikania micrantha TaxID=192012 RepID=A0A5N6MJL4_9ASTR|nr:hypothetical protein E3N88_29465 [Mikania micrantha]